MSIDRISLSNAALDRTLQSNGTDESRPASHSRQAQATVTDDSVSLSESARDADRFASLVSDSRNSRLDAVREALAKGAYRVSGTDIASKLIDLNTR